MTPFLTEDFLLNTPFARRLYHEVAAQLPIIDYHSHLQQSEIAARKKFRNIAELWLGGDHSITLPLLRPMAFNKTCTDAGSIAC